MEIHEVGKGDNSRLVAEEAEEKLDGMSNEVDSQEEDIVAATVTESGTAACPNGHTYLWSLMTSIEA